MSRFLSIVLFLVAATSATSQVQAADVNVAVAANFTAPMQKIAQMFEQETGHKAVLSFGATGNFYAQIKNGATFQVFLAADDTTPAKVAKEDLGDGTSEFTYAVGKLVLWSKKPGFVDAKGDVLKGKFDKLAIANPKLAPYGLAAQETMEKMGLWAGLQDRIVMGESISQTLQFADTGNADMAFIALSQTIKDGKPVEGSQWVVPAALYTPIRQDAILLAAPQDKAAAEAFLKYLKSPKAIAVIRSFGYDL